jgi:Uma2 family endonuclease
MATVPRKLPKPIYYPESDGKPIAETPVHRDNLSGLIEMFRDHYRDDPSVYISGNMFLYFVEGEPRKNVSPDVFVALGVGNHDRRIYCTWREGGKAPDLVVELTSPKTRKEDAVKKFEIYQDILKVREYIRFDPFDEYLKPPLQGHRLVEGRYVPIEPVDGRLPSGVTGVHFFRDGRDLKITNPITRRTYTTLAERRRAIEELEESQRRVEEEQRRAEAERQRAEEEQRRADEEQRRAEAERLRAEEALAEIDRLRRELEALRAGRPPEA